MKVLLILGAGGHAKVVAETAIVSGIATRVVFLDDCCTSPFVSLSAPECDVIGPLALALEPAIRTQFDSAVVAIGASATRLEWIDKLQSLGYNLPSIIHPTAWISSSAQIEPGSVVFAHATVQAQASIGPGTILNTGCSVDHDSQLCHAVHVCPGARLAGGVYVGSRSWIGIGASVIQQVHIGSDVTVGAGAAVVRDLPDGVTAVGVPARVLPSV
jgi:sugar O-acyltransferase (sialic acid O-acetyltransferase NeuD family)